MSYAYVKQFCKLSLVCHEHEQERENSLSGRSDALTTEVLLTCGELDHIYQVHIVKRHRKVLLSSLHLNGHISGLYPQTQNLETPYSA